MNLAQALGARDSFVSNDVNAGAGAGDSNGSNQLSHRSMTGRIFGKVVGGITKIIDSARGGGRDSARGGDTGSKNSSS